MEEESPLFSFYVNTYLTEHNVIVDNLQEWNPKKAALDNLIFGGIFVFVRAHACVISCEQECVTRPCKVGMFNKG